MRTRVHLPIAYGVAEGGRKVKIPTDLPVLFSLGPIRNSRPWHGHAIAHTVAHDAPVFFACPARPSELTNVSAAVLEQDASHYEVFPRQRAWENFYIDRAMGPENEAEDTGGCGWIHLGEKAAQEKHPGKSYAQITMLEVGEMIATVQFHDPNKRVVISYDQAFPEISTVLYEFSEKIPHVPVIEGMYAGLDAALEVALR